MRCTGVISFKLEGKRPHEMGQDDGRLVHGKKRRCRLLGQRQRANRR